MGYGSQRLLFPSSQETLEYLEQANVFTVRLDDERQWYRYHLLFAEMLRNRLRQMHPERVRELHQWASAWYEDQGLAADALHHALEGQDYERAARLVQQHAPAALWQRGETVTVMRWLQALPDEFIRARLPLCIFH